MAPGLEEPAPVLAARVRVEDVAVLKDLERGVEQTRPHLVGEDGAAGPGEQDGLVDDERHLGDDDVGDVGGDPKHGIGAVLEQALLHSF